MATLHVRPAAGGYTISNPQGTKTEKFASGSAAQERLKVLIRQWVGHEGSVTVVYYNSDGSVGSKRRYARSKTGGTIKESTVRKTAAKKRKKSKSKAKTVKAKPKSKSAPAAAAPAKKRKTRKKRKSPAAKIVKAKTAKPRKAKKSKAKKAKGKLNPYQQFVKSALASGRAKNVAEAAKLWRAKSGGKAKTSKKAKAPRKAAKSKAPVRKAKAPTKSKSKAKTRKKKAPKKSIKNLLPSPAAAAAASRRR